MERNIAYDFHGRRDSFNTYLNENGFGYAGAYNLASRRLEPWLIVADLIFSRERSIAIFIESQEGDTDKITSERKRFKSIMDKF